MTTTYDLPMPGDALNDAAEGYIVIASRWGNDSPDDGPVFGEVVLLRHTSPFYAVAQVMRGDDGDWFVHVIESTHMHITEAANEYGEG